MAESLQQRARCLSSKLLLGLSLGVVLLGYHYQYTKYYHHYESLLINEIIVKKYTSLEDGHSQLEQHQRQRRLNELQEGQWPGAPVQAEQPEGSLAQAGQWPGAPAQVEQWQGESVQVEQRQGGPSQARQGSSSESEEEEEKEKEQGWRQGQGQKPRYGRGSRQGSRRGSSRPGQGQKPWQGQGRGGGEEGREGGRGQAQGRRRRRSQRENTEDMPPKGATDCAFLPQELSQMFANSNNFLPPPCRPTNATRAPTMAPTMPIPAPPPPAPTPSRPPAFIRDDTNPQNVIPIEFRVAMPDYPVEEMGGLNDTLAHFSRSVGRLFNETFSTENAQNNNNVVIIFTEDEGFRKRDRTLQNADLQSLAEDVEGGVWRMMHRSTGITKLTDLDPPEPGHAWYQITVEYTLMVLHESTNNWIPEYDQDSITHIANTATQILSDHLGTNPDALIETLRNYGVDIHSVSVLGVNVSPDSPQPVAAPVATPVEPSDVASPEMVGSQIIETEESESGSSDNAGELIDDTFIREADGTSVPDPGMNDSEPFASVEMGPVEEGEVDYTSPVDISTWDLKRFVGSILFLVTAVSSLSIFLLSRKRKELREERFSKGIILTEDGLNEFLRYGYKLEKGAPKMIIQDKAGLGYTGEDSMLIGGKDLYTEIVTSATIVEQKEQQLWQQQQAQIWKQSLSTALTSEGNVLYSIPHDMIAPLQAPENYYQPPLHDQEQNDNDDIDDDEFPEVDKKGTKDNLPQSSGMSELTPVETEPTSEPTSVVTPQTPRTVGMTTVASNENFEVVMLPKLNDTSPQSPVFDWENNAETCDDEEENEQDENENKEGDNKDEEKNIEENKDDSKSDEKK